MHPGRRLRLGILALIAGFAFFGLLGFVLQGVLRDDRVSYFILFEENVKGMVIGSKCNFQGVPIGMVKDIRFQNGSTLVELSVDPTRAVIQDITRARLDRLLVTGQVTVELEGFGPEGRELQPGQFIQPKQDPINRLTKTLPEMIEPMMALMDRLELLLDRACDLLDDENRAAFDRILQNAETLSAALPGTVQRAEALMARSESALAELELAAAGFRELVPLGRDLAHETHGALAGMRALQEVAGGAAEEAASLLASLRAPAQTALTSLRSTLEELRSLARQLRLAPDSLLFGVARPAAPAGGGR